MALTGCDAMQLAELAHLRFKAGASRDATTLHDAQVVLADGDPYWRAKLATILAKDGMCSQARDTMAPVHVPEPDELSTVMEARRAIAACEGTRSDRRAAPRDSRDP
jgi:hypothetical protein